MKKLLLLLHFAAHIEQVGGTQEEISGWKEFFRMAKAFAQLTFFTNSKERGASV